jgi:hypothetical protein
MKNGTENPKTCKHLYFVAATHKHGFYCRGCGRWTFEMPTFNPGVAK